jgi:hypothetical protein
MGTSVHWAYGDEVGRADDVDPAVVAVLDPQDLTACHDTVPDDPVEAAAAKLAGSPRPHPGRYPKFPARRTRSYPSGERVHVAAGESDLRQMEIRHLS